ncbi:MAG: TIGR03905 family TSCPD domain-containing protein [Clostridia bacterium]|nr:TIGR03905 family TSCPD domain-containing protein [Clostridia bacterium]
MEYKYKTKGTCSREISFTVDENGVVTNVSFFGGCMGNLQGISKLVEGMHIDEVIKRLEGIKCGFKPTSCPDQLANALKEIK